MKDVADDLALIVRNAIAYIKELEAELARCKQVCAATAEAWREEAALAEPVQQGCDHCNQPLYAAIKCRVCGRVTQAEPGKPLTEEEIVRIFETPELAGARFQTSTLKAIAVARAVEAAHGIGGQP